MKKKTLASVSMLGLFLTVLAGTGMSQAPIKTEVRKEALREENKTTYTFTMETMKGYWKDANDSTYLYFTYKDGSTKQAPAFPGTKMNLSYYEGKSFLYFYCSITPEDEIKEFYFNNGTNDAYRTTDPIPFFTDRTVHPLNVNGGPSGSHYEIANCRINYVENNATLDYNDMTFQPWVNPYAWPETVGNYYLGVDMEIVDEWTLPEGEVSLLLNGHSVNNVNDKASRYFYVDKNTTFNLYDNSEEKRTYEFEFGNYRYTHIPIVDAEYNEEHANEGHVITGGYITRAYGSKSSYHKNAGKGGAVYNEGTFNMYGGTIMGSNGNGGGGGVYNAGTFNMYGGRLTANVCGNGAGLLNAGTATIMEGASIDDNYASYGGGGIYNTGNLILDNATISNNAANEYGGGIANAIYEDEETMEAVTGLTTLKGKCVINDNVKCGYNWDTDESYTIGKDNLCLLAGKVIDWSAADLKFITVPTYLTIEGDKLSEGSDIGITMEEAGDFSTGLSKSKSKANREFFTADDPNYSVRVNGSTGQLSLVDASTPEEPDHEHVLTYTADGDTITATCSAEDCDLENNKATLTIKAPANLEYDGKAKLATFKEGYDSTVFPNPVIKYYQGSSEVASCVELGKYQARVTFGNATAFVGFEIIGKKVVDPNNPNVSLEINDIVDTEDIELRVEVRIDVAEKDVAEDYAKIQKMLKDGEQIAKVYDVKLVRIVGGVETVIQPSDIKAGLTIKVRMAIPEGVDIKNTRILHIHNIDDMEFVSDFEISGKDIVFPITRLSQFAFVVNTKVGLNGGIIALIVILSILAVLGICFCLLFFIFAKFIIVVENNEEKIVKAIKLGKEKQDDKEMIKLITFKFKKEVRVEEEVFNKKQDAEEFLKNKNKQ
ncbi:MAG: hypothetical protein IJ194_03335 [Bacilli bacterium]|nr:hypothetical protein [Bacilli bacterium]